MPTILHIAKEPEVVKPATITHIDVRLTYDEAFLIGAFAARITHRAAGALMKNGSAIAYRLYSGMRAALDVPRGFSADGQYLVIARDSTHVGQDGFVKLTESKPVFVRAPGGATGADEYISHEEASTRLFQQRDTIRENHKVQGRQAETIAAQTKEIEKLRAEKARLERDLRIAQKMFDDIKHICDAEYEDYT